MEDCSKIQTSVLYFSLATSVIRGIIYQGPQSTLDVRKRSGSKTHAMLVPDFPTVTANQIRKDSRDKDTMQLEYCIEVCHIHTWSRTWKNWKKCTKELQKWFRIWRKDENVWTNNIGKKKEQRRLNLSQLRLSLERKHNSGKGCWN